MNKIKIIHISDIHYDKNEAENQGLILEAFFSDINIKIEESDKDNLFCIISGDLVNKGNSEQVFNDFYEKFILKLLKIVPLRNIYCLPGNHDFNRKILEDNIEKHDEILQKKLQESEFNDFVKVKDNLILKKFHFFENFCKNKMLRENIDILGNAQLFIPELSVYFLNCSLFCSGGFKNISDKGILKIETSGLNQWILENKGRTKMLVMHHPLEYLTDFASSEIKAMLRNEIDILISGHIHEQDLELNWISENHEYIKLGSPQLFSNKTELNGYSIIGFNAGKIDKIEYRQWVPRQRKFMSGQDFSGTEDGIRLFKNPEIILNDLTNKKLQQNFQKAMKSYSKTPKWVERTLSHTPPNSSTKTARKTIDYIDILNKPEYYQIIAAPQFGLTCYAHYLALKAWEVKSEHWVYIDSFCWNFGKYHNDFDIAISELNIVEKQIKCLILDNWKNSLKESNKILNHIKIRLPNIPIIILSNFHDNIVLEGLDSEESHEGFSQTYLCELSKKGLRSIVKTFNDEHQIAEENRVLERLDTDLIDLNIHRTPLNCIQLLIAFLNDFEDRPINRSKVFSYVLKVIFDNPGNLYYGDALDEENCGFIVGHFCEFLLRNNKESFTETEFYNVSNPFCAENYNNTNITDLLQVLKHNQILINLGGELRFRFSYWIYYFAAIRMKNSSDFTTYMLKDKHSLYFPEIIEFYTGIDGRAEDVVKMLIADLQILADKVHAKIGISDDYNPYKDIKWALNETVSGMTQEQLVVHVQNSKLPDEIKDVVADKNYNSVKPYNQTINNFFEEFDVKNLMELTKSASRALRNSEFIKPVLKEELMQKIVLGWKEINRALFLIAPILAKNGFGGVGGARFQLTDSFPKEFNECLKSIIIFMPLNLKIWFKDDLFSDKIILLLRKFMISETDPTIRHVIALMECTARPKGWKKSILEYIGTLNKNSYYLGNLYSILSDNYQIQLMNASEQKDTEYLIKATWAKHKTGSPKPGLNTVGKVPETVLPNRNLFLDE